MRFVHSVIILLLVSPGYSHKQVTSIYASFMQSALEWSLGSGPTGNDHLIIAGMKCSFDSGQPAHWEVLCEHKASLSISFLEIPFSSLLAIPYLPARVVFFLLNQILFVLYDVGHVVAPSKMILFRRECLIPSKGMIRAWAR